MYPAFRFGTVAVAAIALAACGNSTSPPATSLPVTPQTAARAAAPGDAPFRYAVRPHVNAISDDLLLKNCSSSNQIYLQCATPTTIRAGYGFPAYASLTDPAGGYGSTIAIVDPFGSPTIADDINQFSMPFGLPKMNVTSGASCSTPAPGSGPTLTVYYPGGKPTFNPSDAAQVGFAEETSLDVEWAHAAAPLANILLVVPPNDQGQSVQSAQEAAISCPGVSVLSLSFGVQETSINGGANNTQLQQAEQIYRNAKAAGITVVASVGDLGATGGGTTPNPEYPASDPNVLAVGGTNLVLYRNSNYNNESVWNDTNNCLKPCADATDPGATGGAPSSLFTADSNNTQQYATWTAYQKAVDPRGKLGSQTRRWTNDVAYNASPNTGVVVYIGFLKQFGLSTSTAFAIGGTSQGPPQWAGIIATADALRGSKLGFVSERLYKLAAAQATKTAVFHDVSNGNNQFAGLAGYAAGPGYDAPTGLGSANVASLITALLSP